MFNYWRISVIKVHKQPLELERVMRKENIGKESKYRKINFTLIQDEDGYPPFSVESLWGIETECGRYIIDNNPFYVYDISLADEVVVNVKGNELDFASLFKASTNSTMRIFSMNELILINLKNDLQKLDCSWEFSNTKSLSSVNIPDNIKMQTVETVIKKYMEVDDSLDYEISCLRQ